MTAHITAAQPNIMKVADMLDVVLLADLMADEDAVFDATAWEIC